MIGLMILVLKMKKIIIIVTYMRNQFQMTAKLVLQKQSTRLFLLSIETGNEIMGGISTPINFPSNLQNETRLNLLKNDKKYKK